MDEKNKMVPHEAADQRWLVPHGMSLEDAQARGLAQLVPYKRRKIGRIGLLRQELAASKKMEAHWLSILEETRAERAILLQRIDDLHMYLKLSGLSAMVLFMLLMFQMWWSSR